MSGLHLATALVGLAAIALGVVGAAALIAWSATRMLRDDVLMAISGALLASVMLGAMGFCILPALHMVMAP